MLIAIILGIITLFIFFKLFGFSLITSWRVAKFFTSSIFAIICVALFITIIALPVFIIYKILKKKNKDKKEKKHE